MPTQPNCAAQQLPQEERDDDGVIKVGDNEGCFNPVGILRNSSASSSYDDGYYHSSNGCFSRRRPLWWLIRILAVFTVVLAINIGLLLATANNREKQQQGSTAEEPLPTETAPSAPVILNSYKRVSDKLNNATIPRWKPLPDATQTIAKIAFGSCASQEMPQPHWDTITTFQPDLFLLMGDTVYGDCEGSDGGVDLSCFRLREAYRKLSLHPSVQGGAEALSVFATLDDHDYGQSDCHASNPHKDLARELFRDFFDLPTTNGALPTDGVYRSAIWGSASTEGGGRLQVILLDTRYSRSPFGQTGIPSAPYEPVADSDPSQQQMLSEGQWTWLQEQLEEPADVRLIVSSIQVLNDVTGFEAWRHLPLERERLYNLIADKRAILLTGDRHFGGLYESTSSSDIRVVEVTASSFTHSIPLGTFDNCTNASDCDEADPSRIGDAVRENHFGWIDLDWMAETVTVSLRRTESSYGSSYHSSKTSADHRKFSDAGEVLVSKQYSFSDL